MNMKTKVKKESELHDHGRVDLNINYQLKESKMITILSGTSQCGIHLLTAADRKTKHAQM